MTISSFVVGVIGGLIATVLIFPKLTQIWRANRGSSRPSGGSTMPKQSVPRLYSVVNPEQGAIEPYPYVHIEKDGAARELNAPERDYLEEQFSPFDGGRPYVKTRYEDKNGWGHMGGFLNREDVPMQVPIHPAPEGELKDLYTKETLTRLMREHGFEVTEDADGTVTARRVPKNEAS